jgi:hypothetical protein
LRDERWAMTVEERLTNIEAILAVLAGLVKE